MSFTEKQFSFEDVKVKKIIHLFIEQIIDLSIVLHFLSCLFFVKCILFNYQVYEIEIVSVGSVIIGSVGRQVGGSASKSWLVGWSVVGGFNKTPFKMGFSEAVQKAIQEQPFKGVLGKRCSESMEQLYRRTPMPKYDFNNFIEIALRHECSPVNLLHISEHLFQNTPLDGCF